MVGFETQFEVSNVGLIRGIGRQISRGILHPTLVNGYPVVPAVGKVHSVVLRAFVGPCPPGQMCRHLNGDKKDNRLVNLTWGTLQQNRDDRTRHDHERGFDSPKHCKTTHPEIALRCPLCHTTCLKCQKNGRL